MSDLQINSYIPPLPRRKQDNDTDNTKYLWLAGALTVIAGTAIMAHRYGKTRVPRTVPHRTPTPEAEQPVKSKQKDVQKPITSNVLRSGNMNLFCGAASVLNAMRLTRRSLNIPAENNDAATEWAIAKIIQSAGVSRTVALDWKNAGNKSIPFHILKTQNIDFEIHVPSNVEGWQRMFKEQNLVGVNISSDIAHLKNRLSRGAVGILGTNLMGGHWITITGFDASNNTIHCYDQLDNRTKLLKLSELAKIQYLIALI